MKQTIKPDAPLEAWNAEAMYIKAQRYAEKAHSPGIENWEGALWAGLSLELLARAALANVSPVLLADTGERNWKHIYSALGFAAMESKYSAKSIGTNEVFHRLGLIFSALTKEAEGKCTKLTGLRNAELHSGDPTLNGIKPSSWQADYYDAVAILLGTMQIDLKDFIGVNEAVTAEKILVAAKDESAAAVKSDVNAHQRVWAAKAPADQAVLREQAKVWASRQNGHRVICPSCQSDALVRGEPAAAAQQKLAGDLIEETQEYLPISFECVACGLKINGLSKLNVMGLGERYKRTTYYDLAEIYSPTDQFADFEDDNNEPP